MPSETMDFGSFSSSLYSSDNIWSVTERQAGFWKSGSLSKCYDFDQGIKPSLDAQAISKFSDFDQGVKSSLNAQVISKFSDGGEVSIISAQNESNLFSSSLSELFSRKLKLSANDPLYGHSVDTVSFDYEEERLFGSLEELEAQIIGNLLPSDDDLLSGVTDELDHNNKDSAVDDIDELDLFSSVGGMELGDDDRSSSGHRNSEILSRSCNNQLGLRNASTAGGHHFDEHPSETLFVKNINSDVTDSEQKESNLYVHQNSSPLKTSTSFPGLNGVIKPGSMDGGRTLGVEFATCVSFLETPIHAVSSSVPKTLSSLVRVNSVGNERGKTESSSPGQKNFDIQAASDIHPHSLPKCYDGLANGVRCKSPEVAVNINLKTKDNMQFCQVNSNGRHMEFNECDFKSSGNGSFSLPSHHHKWGNSYQPLGMMWPNSPSYFDGICTVPTLQRLHKLPSQMMSTVFPINNQHVPTSAPLWDRRHSYAGESPEAYVFQPGPLGNMRAPHFVDFVPHNIYPQFGVNCFNPQILPKNLGLHFHNQRGVMFPGRNHMVNSFGTYKQRARGHRNDGASNLADKKQFELDIDRIQRGEDNRTTLMIKNIPNKYTSKMLLATIDECHKGTYDFVYLPIDFKNKCNVGYAFINMTDPSLIIPFYQVFNGKRWEKFNSEKVASLAYARIQGKAALVAHFQNSSLMNEDKRCRPILFNTDGPNAGDQVPFPIGANLRNKQGRARNNTHEDI